MNATSYSLHSQEAAGDEGHTLSVVSQTPANRKETLEFPGKSWGKWSLCKQGFVLVLGNLVQNSELTALI